MRAAWLRTSQQQEMRTSFRAGDPEPIRTCLLWEVDANCTARESLTDRWDHSDELTAKTPELLMTLGK